MSSESRTNILSRIAGASVAQVQHPGRYIPAALPEMSLPGIVALSGADLIDACEVPALIAQSQVCSLVSEFKSTPELVPETIQQAACFSIEKTICRASCIVRENGAVWIDAAPLPKRAALFTCMHLIILLPPGKIFETMHAAVEAIARQGSKAGYFIAGPSKTADIEQCLVVGAQGARRVTIALESE